MFFRLSNYEDGERRGAGGGERMAGIAIHVHIHVQWEIFAISNLRYLGLCCTEGIFRQLTFAHSVCG